MVLSVYLSISKNESYFGTNTCLSPFMTLANLISLVNRGAYGSSLKTTESKQDLTVIVFNGKLYWFFSSGRNTKICFKES